MQQLVPECVQELKVALPLFTGFVVQSQLSSHDANYAGKRCANVEKIGPAKRPSFLIALREI
ncbi:hypothetical protein [Serratia rubidaea]|uniref:hypothetical protein n=1 Tax=Serratia rubidaea TaxID=61652 RepID=UPI0011E032C0|nr:hypothetical protein [Serratia rubidaea]